MYGHGGTYFGPTLESWYTSGYDDALVRNDDHPIADSLAYYGPRYGVATW